VRCSVVLLVLLIGLSLGAACRTAGVSSPATPVADHAEQQPESETAVTDPAPWRPDGRGGRLEEPGSGFSFELPLDWTWRRGSGEVLFEARGPDSLPIYVRLSRWDGNRVSAQQRVFDKPLAFLSSGPYGALDVLADEPPVVLTIPEREGPSELALAWLFRISDQGLSLEARMPVDSFEDSWLAVDSILRSAATREAGAVQ